uniref:Uncharacterized protein n=1 Tax=Timema tahoe TaxID=61484 RepID=A0A7R9IM11_9NEOP|nr:unnamed protein product [Timema tahoe]
MSKRSGFHDYLFTSGQTDILRGLQLARGLPIKTTGLWYPLYQYTGLLMTGRSRLESWSDVLREYKTENKVEAPRSLRYRDEENDKLQLTPEFKTFVAKHLSNTIENFLNGNGHSIPVRRRPPLGTKRKTLNTQHSNSSSGDSYSDMEDFASAAVSPSWVISKKGINGWSTPTKGEMNDTGREVVSLEFPRQ